MLNLEQLRKELGIIISGCLTSSAQSAMATKISSKCHNHKPEAGHLLPLWNTSVQCSVSGGPHAVLVSATQEEGSEVTEGAEKQNLKG